MTRFIWPRRLCLSALLACCVGVLTGLHVSAADLQRFDYSAPLMGTTFRVSLHASSRPEADAAADAVFKHVGLLNSVFSDYEPNSEIMKLCRAGVNVPFKASPPMLDLVSRCLDFAQRTDGALDITCGNLTHLWRRTKRVGKLPPKDRLRQALASTDWRAVKVDKAEKTITLTLPGMLLDVGAIGKGYAADEGLRILRERGMPRSMVMAGGDIALGEPPPGAEAWEVKLRTFTRPADGAEEEALETVRLKNCGVSTSGDLYQYTEIDGVRYSHIVSPKTGLGLTERVACCVIAPDCTTSDALDTAMCVLGRKAGEALAPTFPGVTIKFATP